MRALHVIDSLGPGGSELSLAELLVGLQHLGVDSTVACLGERSDGVHRQVVDAGIDVRVLAADSMLGRIRELRRLIRDLRADLVHTTLYNADIVGRVAALRTGVPVVTSLVNTTYEPERLAHDPNLRRSRLAAARLVDGVTARRNTHFHAVTEAVKASAVRHLHVRSDDVTVIYRGRDTSRLGEASPARRLAVRRREEIDADRAVIITAGRQEFQKGHVVLLDAMDSLLEESPAPLLLLAGRPGKASSAIEERLTRSPRLRANVRVLGQRNDVPDLVAAADVFVLPSIYEGAAGALLEALYLETAVVASNLATIAELVGDVAAALVPPDDSDALGQAVLAVLADAPGRQAAARRGRLHFDACFGLDRSTEEMHRLYTRVVSGQLGR